MEASGKKPENGRSHRDAPAEPPSRGPRAGRDKPPQAQAGGKTKEPRISVPLSAASKLLKEKLQSNTFGNARNNRDAALDDSLTLLDVTDTEREGVKAAVKGLTDRLSEAELRHVKIKDRSEGQISLDLSEVPADAILTETREQLRAILPDDRGQALDEAFPWDRFYFEDSSRALRFNVVREGGKLTAWTSRGNGASGHGLNESNYKDDGTPIPADKIFGERWARVLKDMTLLPVDER